MFLEDSTKPFKIWFEDQEVHVNAFMSPFFFSEQLKRLLIYSSTIKILILGRIKVNLCSFPDGSLLMCTDNVANCHRRRADNSDGVNQLEVDDGHLGPRVDELLTHDMMTFRVKCGKVEAEKATNLWAGQCQSKVRFVISKNDKHFSRVTFGANLRKKGKLLKSFFVL